MSSLSFPKFDVEFIVGEQYFNYAGVFKVLALDEEKKTIDIEYLAMYRQNPKLSIGTVCRGMDAQQQAYFMFHKIVSDLAKDRVTNMHLGCGKNEAFTLGYLSEVGKIFVCLPNVQEEIEKFSEVYHRITGDDIEPYMHKFVYLRGGQGGDKYGRPYHRVCFPIPDDVVLSKMVLEDHGIIPIVASSNQLQFNSRNFVFNLFRIGFKLGSNVFHQDTIRNNVEDKNSFDKGVEFAREQNQQ